MSMMIMNMSSELTKKYDVYSKFDLEKHKQTFINYFEAVILPSGEVQYAVPSHQEKLLQLAFPDVPRQEAWAQVPIDADLPQYLLDKARCILCWSKFHIGEPYTPEQEAVLKELIEEGLTK